MGILYAVALVTFLFSPFILNDVVILILTPVIIRYARQHGVDPVPLIVAEITVTNVASSLTPIGNPQNILHWTASGVAWVQFLEGTWWLVLLSSGLTVLVLVPLARRMGKPRELPASVVSRLPPIYLGLVVAVTLLADTAGLSPYIPLGLSFALGFLFTFRSPSQVMKEYDFRALAILYFFVAGITVAGAVLSSSLTSYVAPVARGDQPYSGLFFGLVSNVISNVPATQLVLSTTTVSAHVAPKLAVEAGLAGNLGPVASFANLLALQIAGRAGVSVRKTLLMQLAVGLVSFLPALV